VHTLVGRILTLLPGSGPKYSVACPWSGHAASIPHLGDLQPHPCVQLRQARREAFAGFRGQGRRVWGCAGCTAGRIPMPGTRSTMATAPARGAGARLSPEGAVPGGPACRLLRRARRWLRTKGLGA